MSLHPQNERGRFPSDDANFAVGDVGVHVSSQMPGLLDEFRRLYPESGTAYSPRSTIRMEVRRTPVGFCRSRYAIYGDSEEITQGRHRCEVLPFLEWGVNLRLIATRADYVQLHAASMSLDGDGFIFAGGSGSGKSTLAACLLAHGWQYLCDEFALIGRHSRLLHPFPKALCLKSGSFAVAKRLGLPLARRRYYIKARKGRVAYINPRDLGDHSIGEPCLVKAIVFPKYLGKSDPQCTELSPARALFELAGCLFNRQHFSDRGLSVLTEVVKNARCYRLEVGEPQKTCEFLSHLARGRSAQSTTVETQSEKSIAAHRPHRRVEPSGLSRRDVLHRGMKLAYTIPTVLTLSADHALAAASDPSGICSTALQTGELCATDPDCCSKDCDFGVCR